MAVKKSGLGKGLDSLIAPKTRPEQKTQTTSAAVKPEKETIVKTVVKKEEVKLRISEVEPNREQPRKKFDEDALLELSDILKEQGFIPAAAAAVVTEHNIAHVYGAGRPDEKDKKEMTAFAEAVREKLKSTAGSSKLLELSIRGNRPYRPYGTLPLKISVSSACEGCGTCIRKCPVQAISRTDAKVTDESACITCMRCIAVCPKHARKLGTLMTLAIRQKLKKVCTDRKDAEFVL